MLPPGRARLPTRPDAAGSLSTTKTIGIVRVVCFAARIAAVPETTMRSTRACTSSPTSAGSRSESPLAHRYSMLMVLSLDPAEVPQAAAERIASCVLAASALPLLIQPIRRRRSAAPRRTSGVPPISATPSVPDQLVVDPSSDHLACRRCVPLRMDGSSPPRRSGRRPNARLPTARSAGTSCAQRGWRSGQRAANEQPVRGAARCPVPGIALCGARRRRCAAAARRHATLGTAAISARVYGCAAALEQHLGRALLDDPAGVQHRDLVAQVVDHRDVVADQQVGHCELLLQVLQQVQHLRLHRDVERADRLVGDDQARPRDQRARDRDALALAARELVRIALGVRAAQADRVERLGDARARIGRAPSRRAARRRCGRRAGAGRASRTGPGTPSGNRAAPRAARPATRRSGRGRAGSRGRRSAARAPSPGAPRSTCPSPIRRPARGWCRPAS